MMDSKIMLKGMFNKKQKLDFSKDNSLSLERPVKAKEISRTLSYDNPNLSKVTELLSNDEELQLLVGEHKELFGALAKIPILSAGNIFSILSAAEKESGNEKPLEESNQFNKSNTFKDEEMKIEIERLKKEKSEQNILLNRQKDDLECIEKLQVESIKDKTEKQTLKESIFKMEQELDKNKIIIETLNCKMKAAEAEREKLSRKLESTQNENKSLGPLKELLNEQNSQLHNKSEDISESIKFSAENNKEIARLINADRASQNTFSDKVKNEAIDSPLKDTFRPKDLSKEFTEMKENPDDSMQRIKSVVNELKNENNALNTKLKEADEKILRITQTMNPHVAENMDLLCTKIMNLMNKTSTEQVPSNVEQKTQFLLNLVNTFEMKGNKKMWNTEVKQKRYSSLKDHLIDMSFEIDTLARQNDQLRKEKLIDQSNILHENEYGIKIDQLYKLQKSYDSLLIEHDLLQKECFELRHDLDEQKTRNKDLYGQIKEKDLSTKLQIQREISDAKCEYSLQLTRMKGSQENYRAQIDRLMSECTSLSNQNNMFTEQLEIKNKKLTKYKSKYFKLKTNQRHAENTAPNVNNNQ